MNAEFLDLLRQVGVTHEVRWDDITVVGDRSRFFTVKEGPDEEGRFGIVQMVISERGVPRFFGKCAPASNRSLVRDNAVRSLVEGLEVGRFRVIPARMAKSDRMIVQVSPFIDGPPYTAQTSLEDREAHLSTIKDVAAGLRAVAETARRSDLPQIGSLRTLPDAAAHAIEFLALHEVISPGQRKAIDRLVEAAAGAPVVPQHGDLWAQNLIVHRHQLWCLDFEDYGDITAPVYDLLTLVRSVLDLRDESRGRCFDLLAARHPLADVYRDFLIGEARADGVDDKELDGLLAYHIVHRLVRVLHRTGWRNAAPFKRDLDWLCERLEASTGPLLSAS